MRAVPFGAGLTDDRRLEDDPATGYYIRDGGYVVRNERTGDIVQVSDRNSSDRKAPWDE